MLTTTGLALRNRLAEAGISRRELARRAKTSPATLIKYERGEKSPTVDTLARILDSAIQRRRRWPSLDALAVALFEALPAGEVVKAWRVCAEMLDDEAGADAAETRLFVSRAPEKTGDSRTDALVAAFAEHICTEKQIAIPRWLDEPVVCTPFWWVSGRKRFAAMEILEAPPSFACRGIFVTRGDLERV